MTQTFWVPQSMSQSSGSAPNRSLKKAPRQALRWWRAERTHDLPPRGFVWILHGLGEHSGRYHELAMFLNAWGFDVLAPDHSGHGLSLREGALENLVSLPEMVDGVQACFDYWMTSGPLANRALRQAPWFLLGHSMGALLSLLWCLDAKKKGFRFEFARSFFCSAPPLELRLKVPAWKNVAARTVRSLRPCLKLASGITPEQLSEEAANRGAARTDSLMHYFASPALFLSMQECAQRVQKEVNDLELPIFFAGGENDPIVDTKYLGDFSKLVKSHVKWRLVPRARHEILNDLQRRDLYREVVEWFL